MLLHEHFILWNQQDKIPIKAYKATAGRVPYYSFWCSINLIESTYTHNYVALIVVCTLTARIQSRSNKVMVKMLKVRPTNFIINLLRRAINVSLASRRAVDFRLEVHAEDADERRGAAILKGNKTERKTRSDGSLSDAGVSCLLVFQCNQREELIKVLAVSGWWQWHSWGGNSLVR